MTRIPVVSPFIVLLIAGVVLAPGCRSSASQASTQEAPADAPTAAAPRDGDIVAAPGGDLISFERMMDGVRGMRAVYVGESHNNDYHHAFQLRVIEAMYAQDARLLIGMEMFQRPFQDALDRFVAGETTEEEFLTESEYFSRWRWDWRYYRSILLFAREHGIPVIALNSPREANRRVSQGGGLDALTDEDRKWVAEEIDLGLTAHRQYFENIFKRHPMGPGFDLDAFYASQCVWEDTMAESVARGLDARPGHRIAVIVGSGHVRQRFGVPLRAGRRGADPYSILLGMDLHPGAPIDVAELIEEDHGDVFFFTRPAPRRSPSPKLGVMLARESEGPGLLVNGVTNGSIADLAGVEKDDRLTGLSGTPIATLEELRIALALFDGRIGTLEVLRGGETLLLRFDAAWAEP